MKRLWRAMLRKVGMMPYREGLTAKELDEALSSYINQRNNMKPDAR